MFQRCLQFGSLWMLARPCSPQPRAHHNQLYFLSEFYNLSQRMLRCEQGSPRWSPRLHHRCYSLMQPLIVCRKERYLHVLAPHSAVDFSLQASADVMSPSNARYLRCTLSTFQNAVKFYPAAKCMQRSITSSRARQRASSEVLTAQWILPNFSEVPQRPPPCSSDCRAFHCLKSSATLCLLKSVK
jgi:hypothetical protein